MKVVSCVNTVGPTGVVSPTLVPNSREAGKSDRQTEFFVGSLKVFLQIIVQSILSGFTFSFLPASAGSTCSAAVSLPSF